ncbi:hypothetical protein ACI48J_03560 [Paenibacillus chitinolyticus]|uniref:hypothetical protein n=1 Tax=Paenibacillus chitinolyticus TaxID=79263 RepID=UPI003867E825
MEKELNFLIDYLERSVTEFEAELESDPENEFVQGKIKGLNHALRIVRMYNKPELGNHISVIID